jgi:propanol-preferring alcohol dehydrogenase
MELMRIATNVPLQVHVVHYRLQDANAALDDLRAGQVIGAAILQVSSEGV